jgi:hypothetical protein
MSSYHLQSFYINKKGEIRLFFQNSLEIQIKAGIYLSYKYFDLILLIVEKPGHIQSCPLRYTFFY